MFLVLLYMKKYLFLTILFLDDYKIKYHYYQNYLNFFKKKYLKNMKKRLTEKNSCFKKNKYFKRIYKKISHKK